MCLHRPLAQGHLAARFPSNPLTPDNTDLSVYTLYSV